MIKKYSLRALRAQRSNVVCQGTQLSDFEQLSEPRLGVFADRVADEIVRAAEARERLGIREAGLLHHDRGLDVPMGPSKQLVGVVVVEVRDNRDDPARAIAQLLR